MAKERKFVSSLTMGKDTVEKILNKKIAEEKQKAIDNQTPKSLAYEKKLLAKAEYIPGKINVLSLFSGAGGLDLGMEMSAIAEVLGDDVFKKAYGKKSPTPDEAHETRDYFKKQSEKIINIVYSNDNYKAANLSYAKNFAVEGVKDDRDIRKVSRFPKCDLMLGGFPCPGFSAAGPRLLDDPRNFLYIHYIRALMDSHPLVFIAENVKGLMTMAKGQVLAQMKEDFAAAGYKVTAQLLNAKNYNVPESRERVFIVGVRNDLYENKIYKYKYPEKETGINGVPLVTLKDAIGDLPDKPDDVFDSDYSSIYMSRNRKKTWDDVSYTIQASGRQAPQWPGGKPMKKMGKDKWIFQGNFNRRLSVHEVARIQTFPDWFEFSDGDKHGVAKNNKLNEKYKQIGNAVPVLLAKAVTTDVIDFLIQKLNIQAD